MGHEEVPRGFGLRTGNWGDTADGSGNCGETCSAEYSYWEEPESSQAMDFCFFS